MSPSEVNEQNQELVWQTLYGDDHYRKPKLKEGDLVR